MAVLLVDRIGRRLTLVFSFVVTAISIFLLIYVKTAWWQSVTIFVARGAANTAFTIVYISTGEMYPTSMRTTGLGTASAVARIGGFVAPFVSSVLFDWSEASALIVFGTVATMVALVSTQLPETAGVTLVDSVCH